MPEQCIGVTLPTADGGRISTHEIA